nr:reverse transcriptase domain-containing protein [Tanacetum cinerariifolium]
MNELVNDGIKLSKHEINTSFINGLPKKWLCFCQSLRITNNVKASELALLFDSPNDKEDTRSSQEHLNDLEEEYQARALLEKSKRFFKKGTQSLYGKNKGLIAGAYELDEEEVSSDKNEMVEVKVLMALAEDNDAVSKEGARNGKWVKISKRKVHTLLEMEDNNDRKVYLDYLCIDLMYVEEQRRLKDLVFVKSLADDTKVTIPGVERPWLSEAKDFILPNHDTGRILPSESQRNTTNSLVAVTDSSMTDYDSADESSVCSIHLPPLKKLDGAEPISGPKTIKSILRSKSTLKAEALKDVTINEPSSAPAKGNKSSAALKVHSSPAGKLKSVKIKDDPPLAIVLKELNNLKLQFIKNQSSHSRNDQSQHIPQNKYKTQFKKSCELCGLNNHLTENCYKVLFYQKCERTDHRTCDHAEYISTMNMSQHIKILGRMSSRPNITRPLKRFFPPCIHCGGIDRLSNECLYYPICKLCGSYDHDTNGHNRIISLERKINLLNSKHAFKKYEACGSLNRTITDHYDIGWFKREFVGELIFLKSIPPGIDEADCDPEEEIRLIEKLLYDNSSPRPSEECNSENPDGIPLMNAGEFLEIDPYEEVAQQRQDPEEDPNEEHEPEDEDTSEPSKDTDKTEPFEEDETAITPPPPRHRRARMYVRPQTPMVASTQALIDAFAVGSSLFPLPHTSPAYDQASLGHKTAMIRMRDDIPKEDIPPRRRFVLTAPLPIPGHDAQNIARAADRAEDVGYVKALHASERKMMTFIEEVNLRISYQAQVRRQEKLQEVHQAYLSFEARNRALFGRLEILETHMSRMKWQRQSAKDLAVTQMMRIHPLEARARTDTVEDIGSTCHEAAYAMTWGILKKKITDKYCLKERHNENKRKAGDSSRNNQQQPHKKQNVAKAYTAGPGEKKVYTGDLPLCTKCNYHHTGQCVPKCGKCKRHIKKNSPKLKNHGNGSGNGIAQGRAYALGGRDASPDSNTITSMFLLNNRYAKVLFDTGADRSFVSTTFSALINITPTTLENHYGVKLADGKIIRIKIIIRGCTLNFMNHPFNIDLIPVPLGSFDIIIGMDWLTKYHGVIICDEKIVRVLFRREMLIFQGNEDNQREESRLNIISYTKAQEYMSKRCDVLLAHITMKESKETSKEKRLENVPIVRDFPEVFPEDLSGIPPAQKIEFQIDLVPGAAPVAQAPYRLAPSEMKELAEQLQ